MSVKYDGVGYIRVSTKDQLKGASMEVQTEAVISMLERNKCKRYKIFEDGGISGRDYKDRSGFIEAMQTAIKHNVKYFAIYDTSRFAREAQQSMGFFKQLVNNGTIFICQNGRFDETPESAVLFGILALFDEYRSTKDGEKIKDSHKQRRTEGRFPNLAPMGYKNIHLEDGTAHIVPDGKNAEILKSALKKYAYGELHSAKEVADYLFYNGFKHRWMKPNCKGFGHQLGSKVLNRKFYCGYMLFKKEGKYYKHNYETLISEAEFEMIQTRLKGKRRQTNSYKKVHPDYPLRVNGYCPKCNKKLTGYPSRGNGGVYKYYDCKNKGCDNKGSTDDYHEYFMTYLSKLKTHSNVIDLFLEIVKRRYNDEITDIKKHKNRQLSKVSELERRREGIKESLLRSTTSEMLRLDLEKEYEALSNQIKNMKIECEQQDPRENCEPVLKKAKDLLENPCQNWEGGTINQKIEYQKWIFPENFEIHTNKELRTNKLCLTYSVLGDMSKDNARMAERTGFEPVIGR
ncbi:hypothetical protein GF357_05310 [Candidatus Dojkabacteria bacterium]|nr:hypothetical protein [Candidatus Dojkabacteria bacterium]